MSKRQVERRCVCRMDVRQVQEGGLFSGYGSVFDVVDDKGSKIAPGAFAETLEQHETRNTWPAMFWQHDSAAEIGEWTGLSEDRRGLRVDGALWIDGDHPLQTSLMAYRAMKKRGGIGLSIGFRVKSEDDLDRETGVRTITGVDLFEVSVVSFPANPAAIVEEVKSRKPGEIKTIREFEAFLRDAGGFSREAAKAVASRGFKHGPDPRDEAGLNKLRDALTAEIARAKAHLHRG